MPCRAKTGNTLVQHMGRGFVCCSLLGELSLQKLAHGGQPQWDQPMALACRCAPRFCVACVLSANMSMSSFNVVIIWYSGQHHNASQSLLGHMHLVCHAPCASWSNHMQHRVSSRHEGTLQDLPQTAASAVLVHLAIVIQPKCCDCQYPLCIGLKGN